MGSIDQVTKLGFVDTKYSIVAVALHPQNMGRVSGVPALSLLDTLVEVATPYLLHARFGDDIPPDAEDCIIQNVKAQFSTYASGESPFNNQKIWPTPDFSGKVICWIVENYHFLAKKKKIGGLNLVQFKVELAKKVQG